MSLEHGWRILSAYRTSNGTRFWIITEADRSSTTILLPEEYYGICLTEKQLFCGYLSAHCQVFPRSCETIGLPVALSLPVSVGSELPVCLQVNESSLRVQRH